MVSLAKICQGRGEEGGWSFLNLNTIRKESSNSNRKSNYPGGKYMFKVNNRNTRARYKICSKLTIKTPELCQLRQWRHSGVFIDNFEHVITMYSFLLFSAHLTNTNFRKQHIKAVRDLPTNRREVVLLSFPSLLFNEHIYCPCNDLLKSVIESLLTCDISTSELLVLIFIPSLYQVMSGAGLEWKFLCTSSKLLLKKTAPVLEYLLLWIDILLKLHPYVGAFP